MKWEWQQFDGSITMRWTMRISFAGWLVSYFLALNQIPFIFNQMWNCNTAFGIYMDERAPHKLCASTFQNILDLWRAATSILWRMTHLKITYLRKLIKHSIYETVNHIIDQFFWIIHHTMTVYNTKHKKNLFKNHWTKFIMKKIRILFLIPIVMDSSV